MSFFFLRQHVIINETSLFSIFFSVRTHRMVGCVVRAYTRVSMIQRRQSQFTVNRIRILTDTWTVDGRLIQVYGNCVRFSRIAWMVRGTFNQRIGIVLTTYGRLCHSGGSPHSFKQQHKMVTKGNAAHRWKLLPIEPENFIQWTHGPLTYF